MTYSPSHATAEVTCFNSVTRDAIIALWIGCRCAVTFEKELVWRPGSIANLVWCGDTKEIIFNILDSPGGVFPAYDGDGSSNMRGCSVVFSQERYM